MNNRLQINDFINIGIFVAIYYVVFFATMMLGYIPMLIAVLTLFTGITGGIPFMLFLTRVKKFGMLTIFGFVCGLLSLLMGSGVYPLITSVVFGLIADLILKSSHYYSGKRSVLAYGIFCLWSAGFGINTFLVTNQAYIDSLKKTYGEEYTSTLLNLLPSWMFWVGLVITVIGGLLGGVLGKRVLKKHFERAGIV